MNGQITTYSEYLSNQQAQVEPTYEDWFWGKTNKYGRGVMEIISRATKLARAKNGNGDAYLDADGTVVEICEKQGATVLSTPQVIRYQNETHWREYRKPLSFNRYHDR